MTWEERRHAVKLGFTERQAGVLVTVMLHAGVCIGRQYCAFARIRVRPDDARILRVAPGARLRDRAALRPQPGAPVPHSLQTRSTGRSRNRTIATGSR